MNLATILESDDIVGTIIRERFKGRKIERSEKVERGNSSLGDTGRIVSIQGPQGIQGPAGKDGAPGARGEPGKDGKPGADGKDGAAGREGLPGQTGPRGPKGETGLLGQQGPPGEASFINSWRGEYRNGREYQYGDLVRNLGSCYVAKADTSYAPPHHTWDLVAAGGAPATHAAKDSPLMPLRARGIYQGPSGANAIDYTAQFNAMEATLQAIQGSVPDMDVQYDFGLATFGGKNKPVYVGWFSPGTAGTGVGTINKYTWVLGPNGTDYVPGVVETRSGTWANRTTLAW